MSPPGRSPTGTVTGSQSQTQRYSFGGGGDSASVALDTNNTVVETSIGLPSGVTLTKRASEEVWSYPNVHGDVVAVADETGAKQGATFTYDPYGDTLTAVPDNADGSYDYGWLGQHQRGLEHTTDLQPVIEMGARQYSPLLGRFLETDPIEGGSANDYDYALADPINSFDLDGLMTCKEAFPHNKKKWQLCQKKVKKAEKRFYKQHSGGISFGSVVNIVTFVPRQVVSGVGKTARFVDHRSVVSAEDAAQFIGEVGKPIHDFVDGCIGWGGPSGFAGWYIAQKIFPGVPIVPPAAAALAASLGCVVGGSASAVD